VRHSLTLYSPHWDACPRVPPPTDEPPDRLEAAGQMGPDSQGRTAWVTVAADEQITEFLALATRPSYAGPRPLHPEWHSRAHLAVMLNPRHDHATQWLYAVDDTGKVIASSMWAVPGEEATDVMSKPLDDPPAAQGEFRQLDQDRFVARLRVPTPAIWPQSHIPAGLMIRVGFHEECIPEPLTWPEPVAWTKPVPLIFGDLYRHQTLLRIERLEVPEPVWGPPASTLNIRGSLADDAPRTGTVLAEIILPGEDASDRTETPWQSDGSDFQTQATITFPHRAKWANDLLAVGRLRLTVRDPDGRPLWVGSYPFAFDGGIVVRERYGSHGAPPTRPQPSSSDFVERFRAYILARLPDYRLRTTRQGAPSDFYLEDKAGKVHADLLAPDALDQIAAMLAARFDDWQDALCALAMWIHHPLIHRHSSTWSRVSGAASIDTIPRLGGSFCGDTARLGAAMAEKIGQKLRVPLRGYSMGLRGHLATLLDTPIGRVVIDGMLGIWFHTLDNTRLATLDQMRCDPSIVQRMWHSPRAHGHEFFYGVDNQIIRRWEDGQLVWPTAQQD